MPGSLAICFWEGRGSERAGRAVHYKFSRILWRTFGVLADSRLEVRPESDSFLPLLFFLPPKREFILELEIERFMLLTELACNKYGVREDPLPGNLCLGMDKKQ